LLGTQFDQHYTATRAVGHPVDAFDTSKEGFLQADAFTWFEQALGLGLNRRACARRASTKVPASLAGSTPKLTSRLTP
jgi:hypothetical protein